MSDSSLMHLRSIRASPTGVGCVPVPDARWLDCLEEPRQVRQVFISEDLAVDDKIEYPFGDACHVEGCFRFPSANDLRRRTRGSGRWRMGDRHDRSCDRHDRSCDRRLDTWTRQVCVSYALEFGDELRELFVSFALHGGGLLVGQLVQVDCCDAGLQLRALLLQRGGGRRLEQLIVRHT